MFGDAYLIPARSSIRHARLESGPLVEYRSGSGFDRGLALPATPDPAIVIHRRIAYAGHISLPAISTPTPEHEQRLQLCAGRAV
jgi:hypothetical protein